MTSKRILNFIFTFAGASFVIGAALFSAPKANAWGLRGHQTVCEAAAFNVTDEGLSGFLRFRLPMIAHLCNVPDTSWKNQGPEATALGSPAHYINPEVLGLSMMDVPTDFRKLQIDYEGTDNKFKPGQKIISLARDLGSLWPRVDQFFRRSIEYGTIAAQAKKPSNRGEEQDQKMAYNQAVFEMMQNLFLMGHFIGDAGMPFHSSADYDGYLQGHGGIHGFYEEITVAYQDEKLMLDVISEARRLVERAGLARSSMKAAYKKKPASFNDVSFLLAETPIEKMRAFSALSVQDVNEVLKADVLVKKSELTDNKGLILKVPAVREITPKSLKAFRRLQVRHMSRSAALIATLWTTAYERMGRPDLKPYRSYAYPFEPKFIPPDYFDLTLEKKTE